MALELWRPRGGLARGPFRDLAREFRELTREMDEFVGRVFRDWSWPRLLGEARGWAPAVDMYEDRNEVVVRVDVPGLTEKDLEVTVDEGVLTIRGERREESEAREEDYYACERWTGSFARSLTLPPGVDADQIKASLKQGVLEIRMPKRKETGRRIEVRAA